MCDSFIATWKIYWHMIEEKNQQNILAMCLSYRASPMYIFNWFYILLACVTFLPDPNSVIRNSSNSSLLQGALDSNRTAARNAGHRNSIDIKTGSIHLKDLVCYLSLLEGGRPEDKLECKYTDLYIYVYIYIIYIYWSCFNISMYCFSHSDEIWTFEVSQICTESSGGIVSHAVCWSQVVLFLMQYAGLRSSNLFLIWRQLKGYFLHLCNEYL